MGLRNSRFHYRITHGFWLIPLLMIFLSTVLVYAVTALDKIAIKDRDIAPYGIEDIDGFRAVMVLIGGSAMTVAGVVFSVTIVALSLATQQFGASLIRSFMKGRTNQITFGILVSAFLFCVIAISRVERTDSGGYYGELTLLFAIAYAVSGIVMLSIFLHRISRSIQSFDILGDIASEFKSVGFDIYKPHSPKGRRAEISKGPQIEFRSEGSSELRLLRTGFIQIIKHRRLIRTLENRGVQLKLLVHPGNFVTAGSVIARVRPGSKASPELERMVNSCIVLGIERIPGQDPELIFEELLEVALKGMSQSKVDPVIASSAMDWIGAGLGVMVRHGYAGKMQLSDRMGEVRVFYDRVDLTDVMNKVLDSLRYSACSNEAYKVRGLNHLMRIVVQVYHNSMERKDRDCLLVQAKKILEALLGDPNVDPDDKKRMKDLYDTLIAADKKTGKKESRRTFSTLDNP